MNRSATIDFIKIIAKALGELNDKAVFVGGATVPFYLPAIYEARVTEDIDVVMEIMGRTASWANDEKLREKGFKHDTSEGAPVCRWIFRDFKVDVMSSDVSALGFTNKWYKEGVERAIEVVSDPVKVRIFSLPYFIASKLEAFKNRGKSDYIASSDMEDIIAVLEVSTEKMFEDVISETSEELKKYLKEEFRELLKTSDFIDALPGAVFNKANDKKAVQNIIQRLETFIKET